MANTETLNTSRAVGAIDATGAIGTITVKGSKLLDISVDFDTSTAFVGTIVLQRETSTGVANIAEWQDVESYTSSVEKVAQSATTRRYRLNCTTATSGQAEYELSAGNFS
jgi:hypothetical protein